MKAVKAVTKQIKPTKREAQQYLRAAVVNEIGKILGVNELNGGAFLADIAILAKDLPNDATLDDCRLSAKAVAAAAGRPGDAPMVSRITIVFHNRAVVPGLVAKLKAARTCTRDHVLSALRFMRKQGKTADQAVALVIRKKRVGAAKAADPVRIATKALTKLRDSQKRGKLHDAAVACLKLLAPFA